MGKDQFKIPIKYYLPWLLLLRNWYMFHLFSVYINITQFKIKENIISSDYFSKGNEGFSKDIYAAFSWRKVSKSSWRSLCSLDGHSGFFPKPAWLRPQHQAAFPADLCPNRSIPWPPVWPCCHRCARPWPWFGSQADGLRSRTVNKLYSCNFCGCNWIFY